MSPILLIIICLIGAFLFLGLNAVLVYVMYKKVRPGQALIINKMGPQPVVSFRGGLVLPAIHQASIIDITAKQITLTDQLVTTQDNQKATVTATFTMKINQTQEDVIHAADQLGVERASSQEAVAAHFRDTLLQSLTKAAAGMPMELLQRDRELFRAQIVEAIGTDLQGFGLEDVAIASVNPVDPDLAADLIAATRQALATEMGARLQEQLRQGEITRTQASQQLLQLVQTSLETAQPAETS